MNRLQARRHGLRRYRKHLEAMIAEQGFAVSVVAPSFEREGWAYTVGLHRSGLPELIVIGGLPTHEQYGVLHELAMRAGRGKRYGPGERLGSVLVGYDAAFIEVMDTGSDWFEVVNEVQSGYRALQLVWPDHGHRFPWDDGYDLPPDCQPLLGLPPGD